MKIGILLTCYNCVKYVDACIKPWMNLRGKYDFVFACNSGMFRDYFDLGIEENNQETIERLITQISRKNYSIEMADADLPEELNWKTAEKFCVEKVMAGGYQM